MIVFVSPIPSEGIVAIQALFLIVPKSALMNDMPDGAVSVTLRFFSSTSPVLVTASLKENSWLTATSFCSTPSTVLSISTDGKRGAVIVRFFTQFVVLVFMPSDVVTLSLTV